MASTLVQIRVDDKLKTEASALYEALGIDLPTAIRMFLKRSVMVRGIPFSMTLPMDEYKTENDAVCALQETSAAAKENGTADMTLDEINAEIKAARIKKKI